MAVTTTFYNDYKEALLGGGTAIDLDADTIKIALVTSSYTPNIDTDDFWDDVSANEISATGYTAGGYTLLSPTVSQDNTDNEGVFDCADPTWTLTTSATWRYAVVYKSTGTASTSRLICYIDLGGDVTMSNGVYTLTINAEGLVNIV